MLLKRIFIFCLTAISILMLASCRQHEYLNLELPGGETQLSFDKEGGHRVLTLSSSSDWKARTTPDWVVLGFTSGTPSAKSLKVSLWVNPNRGAERSCDIVFYNDDCQSIVSISQKGAESQQGPEDPGGDDPGTVTPTDYTSATPETIASFVVKANTECYYKLSGTVSSFNATTFEMTLTDDTGSIFVHEVVNKSEWTGQIHENGYMTIAGRYHYYSGKRMHEVIDAHILSFTPAGFTKEPIPVTIAEFNSANASETQSYRLEGRISRLANTVYGNFDLSDATGSVFVYGLTASNLGFGTDNDKSFASLGLAEGDEIVIIGFRSNYNGQIEVKYSYFVEKTASGIPIEPPPDGNTGDPDITADFRSKMEGFPQSNSEGLTEGSFTWSGQTFIIHAADKFYQAKSDVYFLILGKQNSYIQLPVLEGQALTGIRFHTGSQASENVIIDIQKPNGTRLMVNDSKLKKATEYSWTFEGEKDVAYRIIITNNYNAQFQYISLYYD